MPANVERRGFRPKREFKRGFWWTLGAVTAYAVIGGGIALALAYLQREQEGAGAMPLGTIDQGEGCATGACPGLWAR